MKKILIISEHFAPNNSIAAVRCTKLAKYFKTNSDYHITVISGKLHGSEIEDPILKENLKYVDNHILINDSKIVQLMLFFRQKILKTRQKTIKREQVNIKIESAAKQRGNFLNKVLNSRIFLSMSLEFDASYRFIKSKSYVKIAAKHMRKNPDNFDVILSSYGPVSSHLIGYEMKKRLPNALWIADFRDPVISFQTKKRHLNYLQKYINMISENADIITGVSDACVQSFSEKCNDMIFIICNGFDRDDINGIDIMDNEKMIFTYAGVLYKGKRDLGIIFKAIRELICEDKINKNNILINYAGTSSSFFLGQCEEYNSLDIVKIFGFVSRKQSLQLQLSSDILLLASWNSIGETGVVTGKFLEYLMINKPIICSITGNLSNSQLKEMIGDANNGIVWEEANHEIDYPKMKAYILDQYNRYINNEPLNFNPNMEYIEQYNYKNITQKIIDIIEKHEELHKQ